MPLRVQQGKGPDRVELDLLRGIQGVRCYIGEEHWPARLFHLHARSLQAQHYFYGHKEGLVLRDRFYVNSSFLANLAL